MKRIDGIIAVPKGLKREARRLVAIAFMLAPIGALSAVAAVGVNGKTTSNLEPSSAAPTAQSAAPSLASPTSPPVADQGAGNKASSSVELHTTQSAPGSAPKTELKVNQQTVDIPPSGTVHKVISNDNSTTTLDVSHSSSSISDGSSSSTNIQLNTSSSTVNNSNSDTSTGP